MYIDEKLIKILEPHRGETIDVSYAISLIKTIAKEHETEQCDIPIVSKRYYHEVCGKGTLIKEYEHSVYGTMLMVKPLKQKDIYFAPKREFTELPFS